MSSSCVPPKGGCVVHSSYTFDPDPCRSDDPDADDSSSECGSLCTCTSSSMTSLATSIGNREPNRLGQNSVSSASLAAAPQPPAAAPPAGTQAATQTTDNPYIVVFVPPQIMPGSSCGNCQSQSAFQSILRLSILRVCEFCPWLVGFVIIYYSFHWWGLGPAVSAFLLMVGAHAIIRFVKARGVLNYSSCSMTQQQQETDSPEAEDDEGEGSEDQQEGQNASEDVINEKPPSYEAAMVKPPPYDLQFHLTPTQPRNHTLASTPEKLCSAKSNFLTVPGMVLDGKTMAQDDEDDVFLPSYQDAIRLSFRSNNDPTESQNEDEGS